MAKKIEMLNDQQEVVHPLTSSDCVIMENGKTLEEVMGDGIATPTVTHEGASFQVGVGDSNIEVVDGDVADMTLEGQTYQNILPKPTTLIMETDEKEFKINDKIDNNIVLDDNVAEIATIKGQTYVNVVQEESASEYVAIDEELNGQSITTTGKPEGVVKNTTLEGLTLVNTIQEPSGADATVLELDADIDAQYATIDNTVQGGIHGATLKGRTLKNINDYRISVNSNVTIGADGTITINANGKYTEVFLPALEKLPSTKYWVGINVIENTLNGDFNICAPTGNNCIFNYFFSIVQGFVGVKEQVLTTMTDLSSAIYAFRSYLSSPVTEGVIKYKVMAIPYQEGMENWDIPYFEGMKSVEVPSVKTMGKNLVKIKQDYTFTKNGITFSRIDDNTIKVIGTLSQTETSAYLCNINLADFFEDGKRYNALLFNSDGTVISNSTGGTLFAKFNITKHDETHLYTDDFVFDSSIHSRVDYYISTCKGTKDIDLTVKIFVSQTGEQSTTYEPYKSSTLTTPSDVVLRKVGNVQDELDLETGKLTQRIGEMVLDGSENWKFSTTKTNTQGFELIVPDISKVKKNLILSDLFGYGDGDIEKIATATANTNNNFWAIYIAVLKTKASSVDEFKTWLASNPVTVQYPLATELIKTVDLSIVDQSNNPLKSIQTHPTLTHVSTSSQGLIPNIVIPSQLKYPTIIKPSTTYTVRLKQTTINSEFPLTINLGGTVMAVPSTKFTITTPETLTSQDAIFTGKNNVIGEVVITEGDTTGIEYSYFEGMLDVKSPKSLATGKNLFDGEYELDKYLKADGTLGLSTGWATIKNYISVRPNTTYTQNIRMDSPIVYVVFYDKNKNIIGAEKGLDMRVGNFAIYTTPNNCYYIKTCYNYGYIGNHLFQVEEGSVATSYEPYKGVTIEQSIDYIPLTSSMFEQGGYDGSSTSIIKGMSFQQFPTSSRTDRIKSKTLIKVKPNTTYNINDLRFSAITFDKNGGYNSVIDFCTSFTTDSNTYYLGVNLSKTGNSDITPSSLDSLNLTLQEVTDEIVLRSLPNGVKDTLSLTTGEYVQRVGEVVLDGSDDEKWVLYPRDNYSEWTTYQWRYTLPSASTGFAYPAEDTKAMCDKLKYGRLGNDIEEDYEHYRSNGQNANGISEYIYIWLSQSKASITEELKQYLQSNPIKIQYELATPIIKKVNLTNTTKLPSYASTTHYDTIVPSNSLVPNIKIPSTIDYNVAIKPSTQYTIRANTTSAMSVDLGGSTGTLSNGKVTLTTPSTLAHNSLKLGNGKAKEVMVIEGSEIKDNVPFFNGMKNVQMGGIKLVNIARHERQSSAITANTNKTQFTYTSNGANAYHAIYFDSSLLKTNTVYTVFADITTNTSDNVQPVKFQFGNASGDILDVTRGFVGKIKQTITSANTTKDGLAIVFRPCSSGGQVVIQNPMIIEGDWTHLDEIPFIENEMIIEQPIIRSQGKNLFDGELEVGTVNSDTGLNMELSSRVRTKNHIKIKPNTSYSLQTSDKVIINRIYYFDSSKKYISNQPIDSNNTNKVFPQNAMYIRLSFANQSLTAITNDDINNIKASFQLEEGTSATSYEPFKQHTLSSNRVIGYEEDCYYAVNGGVKTTQNAINSMLADVEGLSIAYVTGGSSNYTFWDKDNVYISSKQYLETSLSSNDKNGFITVQSNAKYMRFAAGGETNAQPLYKVATVTGELPLRSLPSGVCDSFNLVTGEYVQRVGEVLWNGKEDWMVHATWSEGSILCLHKPMDGRKIQSYAVCDRFKTATFSQLSQNNIAIAEGLRYESGSSSLYVFISKDRLMSHDVNGFKQYLSQNPVTVQYELDTPIVRKIGLVQMQMLITQFVLDTIFLMEHQLIR